MAVAREGDGRAGRAGRGDARATERTAVAQLSEVCASDCRALPDYAVQCKGSDCRATALAFDCHLRVDVTEDA